jgi:hypothetical protein
MSVEDQDEAASITAPGGWGGTAVAMALKLAMVSLMGLGVWRAHKKLHLLQTCHAPDSPPYVASLVLPVSPPRGGAPSHLRTRASWVFGLVPSPWCKCGGPSARRGREGEPNGVPRPFLGDVGGSRHCGGKFAHPRRMLDLPPHGSG